MSNSIQYLKMNTLLDDYYRSKMEENQSFLHELAKRQEIAATAQDAVETEIRSREQASGALKPSAGAAGESNVHQLRRNAHITETHLEQVDKWIVKVVFDRHAEAKQSPYAPEATETSVFVTQIAA